MAADVAPLPLPLPEELLPPEVPLSVDPDEEPVVWTEGEMGRALFYYDGVVNQRFLTVHS